MSLNLAKAPIIEAVIEFYCELPPGQDRSGWESALKARFGDRYPQCLAQHLQEFHLQVPPGVDKPAASTVRQGLQGYRNVSPDGKQLIQCRVDGFFFNRLAPYTSFDDYLPEALRCWALYCEVAEPVIVRHIGLRFINRLPLPLVDGKLSLADYLKNPPRVVTLSDKYPFTFTEFVHQHKMVEPQTQTMATVVLASQPLEGNALPVILEIAALRSCAYAPTDHPSFEIALQGLRELKNHVFENTLTEKCLNLFQ
jgi:uncharacterized protein (TIGR04255 family)